MGRVASPTEIGIAMNVEAQAIDVPTGVQDYRPAYYGGIARSSSGRRRQAVWPSSRPGGSSRLVLAYTGAPILGHQQLGGHQASH